MKFYKRLPLDTKNPLGDKFSVELDGRIQTNSTRSIQVPAGNTVDRPDQVQNGQLRYNSDIPPGGEFEAYIGGEWRQIKTNRQNSITKNTFNNGDYNDTYFGPLAYNTDTNFPQNVFVLIENVLQIADTNYVLEGSTELTPITINSTITQTVSLGDTVINVASIADFGPGQPIICSNTVGSIVVSTSATDRTVTITPGALDTITSGTAITTILSSGTYVRFTTDSVPTPSKPVTVLQGFDGYGPPFTP